MINNDILRRLSSLLGFNDEKICSVFKLNACDITTEQMVCFFKEKDDVAYIEILDAELASFLNGLIVEKRGAKEGPQAVPENVLSNNAIFNKLKIAFSLHADEVIDKSSLVAKFQHALKKSEKLPYCYCNLYDMSANPRHK